MKKELKINELKDSLKDFFNASEKEKSNVFIIRFHRLVLDGSYNGYDYYMNNVNRLLKFNGEKKILSIAIANFKELLRQEFNGLILSNRELELICNSLNPNGYDLLTKELYSNAIDLKESHM